MCFEILESEDGRKAGGLTDIKLDCPSVNFITYESTIDAQIIIRSVTWPCISPKRSTST
jgi:hypothetical protein